MSIRSRIRRAWFGRDLYDRAVCAVNLAENTEAAGRVKAYAFIRRVHLEHPDPNRMCIVPDCCNNKAS